MKRALFGFLLSAAFIISPLFASAQMTTDIQSQIQALLAQIEQLKTQITQLQATGGTWATQSQPSVSCPQLKRRLVIGSRGSEVTALQSFLVEQKLLSSDAVSGFFGPLTQHAVEQFQSDQRIVSSGDPVSTGWGAVGPTTVNAINRTCGRSLGNPATPPPSFIPGTNAPTICPAIAMVCPAGKHDQVGMNCSHTCVDDTSGAMCSEEARQCPDGSWVSRTGPLCTFKCLLHQTTTVEPSTSITPGITNTSSAVLQASPTTGKAPLAVRFSYTISGATVSAAGYLINFGDGTSATPSVDCGFVPGGSEACPRSLVASHTYANAGTYTATLSNSPCNGNVSCMAPVELLGSVTITVTGPSTLGTASCTFNNQTIAHGNSVIAYQSSTVPSGSQCVSKTRTCNNGVLSGSYTAAICTVAYSGPSVCPAIALFCPVGTHDQIGTNCSHTCIANTTPTSAPVGSCAPGYLGGPGFMGCGTTSTVLQASPTTGKAPLAVRFSYTISGATVSAAGYLINFGDGTSATPSVDCGFVPGGSEACPRSLVASHTYANAGTYTATLSNSPCNGNVSCMAPVELLGSVTITVTGPSTLGTASCTFNNQTIAHGNSVIAYQSSTVPSGSQCVSKTRTCNNGVLSGSYTAAICTVAYSGPSVCPAIALFCPVGTHDQIGTNCSHSCVPNSGLETSVQEDFAF